ncbi:MAG: hypothetical protein AAFO89_13630 [Planctomycetota bacterium]
MDNEIPMTMFHGIVYLYIYGYRGIIIGMWRTGCMINRVDRGRSTHVLHRIRRSRCAGFSDLLNFGVISGFIVCCNSDGLTDQPAQALTEPASLRLGRRNRR